MRRVLTSGIFVVFCFLTVVILAQVPQLLNYQGRLTDDKGIPIITPTTVRFSLYQGGDAATPGSGTLVYKEDALVTPDDNGVFNHLIGSGTVISGTLDSTVFQTADPVFLEIAVDPAGANETLLPRKQIVTVGYSFKSELADDADTVDGEDASAFAPVVHNHDPDYVNEGQADSVNSSMLVDGTIVDADINAGANIAASKLDRTGLDADLLDGVHASGFYTKSVSDSRFVNVSGDNMTGKLTVTASDDYVLYVKNTSSLSFAHGIYAQSDSPWSHSIYGKSEVEKSSGVYGESTHDTGYGVRGKGRTYGVYGEATAYSGYSVYGLSVSGYAVYGNSFNGWGVYGFAGNSGGTNYGVYGRSDSTNGYAGYFMGKTHVQGTFTATTKSCVQEIEGGKKVLLYAMESPEIWFEDFGTAQLVNGQAVVQLESVFLQTANTEIAYFVFPIPNGECNGLYISRKDKDSFEVRELGDGTSNISFDYRIVAKRRGYEEVRFEEFTEPEQLPVEPNLPIEKK